MTLKAKLLGAFSVVVVIIFVIGGLALSSLSSMNQNGETMYEDRVMALSYLIDIVQHAEMARGEMLTSLLTEEVLRAEEALGELEYVDGVLEAYAGTYLTSEEAEALSQLESEWLDFSAALQFMNEEIQNGNVEAATRFTETAATEFAQVEETLESLIVINEGVAGELNAANQSLFEQSRMLMIAAAVAAVLAAAGLGIFLGRSIGGAASRVSDYMKAVAAGDLTREPLQVNRKDELGELMTSANTMQESLQDVLQGVADASSDVTQNSEELLQSVDEMRNGSEQVASTMEELASGAELQAGSAGTLAESIEAFLEQIEASRIAGEAASENTKAADEAAAVGRERMASSLTSMEDIHDAVRSAVADVRGLDEKTKNITSLVDMIQGVADQTNLLALNAAIEAARAGEHGRGFAVVADEVRKLAEQVSVSVSEITSIVHAIQQESAVVAAGLESGFKKAEAGAEQVRLTGEAFETVQQAAAASAERMQGLTGRLAEVTAGSGKIRSSISEVASVSQQSAAGIEETAASTEQSLSSMEEIASSSADLARLAENLQEKVQQFQLRA
ncbi:methyl-accepting chemotaxis protein [Alkalicoccus luteus]|uniref:methyl-accepting chemotaxis protein n=1 Tax=Alkalicoccus luteus TaxID=1237094 RepID=UPI0040342880